jgi:hypothetical protein
MTGHVHEPHIPCPKCGHQIPLTESIAAPLLEAERRSFQTKLAAKETEYARKADQLRQQQEGLIPDDTPANSQSVPRLVACFEMASDLIRPIPPKGGTGPFPSRPRVNGPF